MLIKYIWALPCLAIHIVVISLSAYAGQTTVTQRPDTVLTLTQAIKKAHHSDPWLNASAFRQQSLEDQSIAAATLPDPKVSVGLANLPVDSFDFNQEAMTQLKVGVVQQLPRGDSLSLTKKRLVSMSLQHPLQREDRRAKVAVIVAHLWLDAYRARESIRLIEQDRRLFEHLVDVAKSSYASALRKTRQQDLVRAQLELTRLEDRLIVLHERQEMALSKLVEWLDSGVSSDDYAAAAWETGDPPIQLATDLPRIKVKNSVLFDDQAPLNQQVLLSYLLAHPAIKSLDQKINASSLGIALEQQKYKPQWGINANYGYRDDAPMGSDRADFFSIGVTFDLPLFTSNRQDKEVQSAVSASESIKTEKQLALRKMLAEFATSRARLLRLNQRKSLYAMRLLEQIHAQTEASLTAYTNDDGDFAEAVRARIAELNSRIDALDIDVDRLKTIAQLNYLLTTITELPTEDSAGVHQ